MKALNKLIRTFFFWRWMFHAMVKQALGRYFVFRKVPTWVIEDLLAEDEPEPGEYEPEVYELYQQAKDEMRLRQCRKELQ